MLSSGVYDSTPEIPALDNGYTMRFLLTYITSIEGRKSCLNRILKLINNHHCIWYKYKPPSNSIIIPTHRLAPNYNQ